MPTPRRRQPGGVPAGHGGEFAPEQRAVVNIPLHTYPTVADLAVRLSSRFDPGLAKIAVQDFDDDTEELHRLSVAAICGYLSWLRRCTGRAPKAAACLICGTPGSSPCSACAERRADTPPYLMPDWQARTTLANRFGGDIADIVMRNRPVNLTRRDHDDALLQAHWLASGQAKAEVVAYRRALSGTTTSGRRPAATFRLHHVRRGGPACHVGHGIWAKRCTCGELSLSQSGFYTPAYDEHQRLAHGLEAQPLLPPRARAEVAALT